MVKKRKKEPGTKTAPTQQKLNHWMLIAIVAIFFSLGLVAKVIFFPKEKARGVRSVGYQTASTVDPSLEEKVMAVSANFRCACGGCGELPLIQCECDMPRGAKEEKDFMRRMLKEGFSVERVIQLVDEKYGHRET